ncbi:MAG: hypothetical protein ACI9DJ_001056 [Algoriphagus sp.]|jgi:hypothetical protein
MPNTAIWALEESKYSFVATFRNIHSQIVGEGNLERFDYWFKAWQGLKLQGQYGCDPYQFENAVRTSS